MCSKNEQNRLICVEVIVTEIYQRLKVAAAKRYVRAKLVNLYIFHNLYQIVSTCNSTFTNYIYLLTYSWDEGVQLIQLEFLGWFALLLLGFKSNLTTKPALQQLITCAIPIFNDKHAKWCCAANKRRVVNHEEKRSKSTCSERLVLMWS